MPLTAKQQRFVDEYPVDWNATEAAKRAGYSSKTAGQQGHRLLKNVEIQKAISRSMQEKTEDAEVTVEWVLKRLKQEAEDTAEKGSSRVAALNSLAKYLGMHVERRQIEGDLTVEIVDKRPPAANES